MDAAKWIRHTATNPVEHWWRRAWEIAEYFWNIDIRTARAIGRFPVGSWHNMEMDIDVFLAIAKKELEKGIADTPMVPIIASLINEGKQRVIVDVKVNEDNSLDFRNLQGISSI